MYPFDLCVRLYVTQGCVHEVILQNTGLADFYQANRRGS